MTSGFGHFNSQGGEGRQNRNFPRKIFCSYLCFLTWRVSILFLPQLATNSLFLSKVHNHSQQNTSYTSLNSAFLLPHDLLDVCLSISFSHSIEIQSCQHLPVGVRYSGFSVIASFCFSYLYSQGFSLSIFLFWHLISVINAYPSVILLQHWFSCFSFPCIFFLVF